MIIFKNTWFDRFAGREGITDDNLRTVVEQINAGHSCADLGGGVYKVRVARPDGGKSRGYRVIVFFRSGERAFFHYAYPKSSLRNISQQELKVFRKIAKDKLAMTGAELAKAVRVGELIEIQEATWNTGARH